MFLNLWPKHLTAVINYPSLHSSLNILLGLFSSPSILRVVVCLNKKLEEISTKCSGKSQEKPAEMAAKKERKECKRCVYDCD